MKLSNIVNKSNKWIFCNYKISRFLVFNPNLVVNKKKFFINFQLIKIVLFSVIIIFIFYLLQFLYFFKKRKNFKKFIILKTSQGHDYRNILKII